MELMTSVKNAVGWGDADLSEQFEQVQRKHVIATVITVALAMFWVSPLWGGITTAFKTQSAFITTLPLTPPTLDQATLSAWATAWETLSPTLWNSLIFTIPAMVFSAVLGSFAAYGLSMVDWRGQVALMTAFILAIFLPKQGILLPLSRFWNAVDLEGILTSLGYFSLPFADPSHTNLIILIITHSAYGVSIATLLFRGYYLTIDHDIVEAARIDGAGIYAIYRHIILPLSYPMFMVVFIFQFTQIYNEFLYALILVGGSDPSAGAPVTLALAELNSGFSQNWNNQMAGAFITAIPTLIVYIAFGEQFAKGVKY
jgi:glucose/mannose transport system permease protein